MFDDCINIHGRLKVSIFYCVQSQDWLIHCPQACPYYESVSRDLHCSDECCGCISLILGEEQQGDAFRYCLAYHMELETCPRKCPNFKSGPVGSLDEVVQKRFNKACKQFTRKERDHEWDYYCNLYRMFNPFCRSCQFPDYLD